MKASPVSPEPLFPQLLLDTLASHPDRTAFEHGSRVVSCGELLAIVRKLAGALRDAGLGPGRGVAILTAVTPEAFAANVAAHVLGCRVAGLRPGWSKTQLASLLTGEFDAVVGDPSTLTPELVALADPAVVLSLGAHPDAIDLLGRQDDDSGRLTVEARPDEIARVIFTSGSTGTPKACARTYRTFSLAYRPDRWAPDLARLVERFERYLVHNSFSMPVVLTFTARCLMTGGTAVIPDEDPRPHLPSAIERHGITGVVMIVPSLHRTLAQLRDDPLDLRCLRALVVTGSPAGPGLLAAAVDRLGPVVWQGYGQAESGMISLLTPEDIARFPDAMASVGRPLPDVDVSVRDQDDRPVGPDETGEICVRSPHVMAGYWAEPQRTHEVLGDGWLHTGDLGHVDISGLLRLTGRNRDVIIVNAEVCYAGAIEQVLARHPDVDQAYVVGVPDERTGEAVHAFIVPAADRLGPDREALVEPVRAELTANHVPETITVVRDVPVAAGGKPDKRALAELAGRRAATSES